MNFVWFWTFWHWSKESFREGSLLRGPLHGVGSHWDEWYSHESSVEDRLAIEQIGQHEATQQEFIAWLFSHWSKEMGWEGNRFIPRFVVGQLAQLPPFDRWKAFARYRDGYGSAGISAVVLAEESAGEADDVRRVEAVLLPNATDPAAPKILAEGFVPDGAELKTARLAALGLLGGRGLLTLLGLWTVAGRRPYARWRQIVVGLGWVGIGVTIAAVLTKADLDGNLELTAAILLGAWSTLVVHAVFTVMRQGLLAWRQGRQLQRSLEASQVRLRMAGGLTLRGASAGLAFCLNTLLALFRAQPDTVKKSWVWLQCHRQLETEGLAWAATGIVTAEGWLKPVVLAPKIRACLRRADIVHLLTPHQPDARQSTVDRMVESSEPPTRNPAARAVPQAVRLGFASETRGFCLHCSRHVAQLLMHLGQFTSRGQRAMNAFALVVSIAMVFALPDIRALLLPPPAPELVAPGSPSPYYLWVSLATTEATRFRVTLESDFWSNRVAEVKSYGGANASVRAEISMHRVVDRISHDEESGTLWVERRRWFLGREFAPGERIGRYPLSYVSQISP